MSISQDVENRINIVELVSKYVPLKKAGASFKACCPFHNEKTPSFIVSPTKNIAYCYGCHKGGGPLRFLMEIEKIEFREALGILAKEAGIELKTEFSSKDGENRADLYSIYKMVAEAYRTELYLPENAEKLEYVRGRGLTDDTVAKFGIGYSGNPRELFARLKSKGISEKDLLDSGIFVGPGRDKFYGRIVFPIANYSGNVVAFTGRIIGAGEPKYLNSPASKIFDKSSILYGLHLAKGEISKKKTAIVVEGQMDTVSLHQAGITNAVGISGTALTKDHISYLKRLTEKVYLCLDSDDAGIKATFASLENFTNEEMEVRIVRIPSGKDPDEFVKSGGNFETLLQDSLSVIDFLILEGRRKFDVATAPGRTALIREILKFVKGLSNRIEADMRLREVSRNLDVSLPVLYAELSAMRESRPAPDRDQLPEKKGFELGEILAAYVSLYGYYGLFSEKFPYTADYCREIPSFSVVERLSQAQDVESSGLDVDRHRATEFQVETENAELPPEAIEKKFLELLSKAAKIAFESEKKWLSERFDPNGPEYLSAYHALMEKGKKLGLKPNRA